MSNFTASRLSIPDLVLVKPRKFSDARGYFVETYVEPAFHALGIDARGRCPGRLMQH